MSQLSVAHFFQQPSYCDIASHCLCHSFEQMLPPIVSAILFNHCLYCDVLCPMSVPVCPTTVVPKSKSKLIIRKGTSPSLQMQLCCLTRLWHFYCYEILYILALFMIHSWVCAIGWLDQIVIVVLLLRSEHSSSSYFLRRKISIRLTAPICNWTTLPRALATIVLCDSWLHQNSWVRSV